MELTDNSVGYKQIVVVDNCEFEDFYHYTYKLAEQLNIVYTKKFDDFDTLYWDFNFMDSSITVYYNTFLGISIYPSKGRNASDVDNKVLIAIYNLIKN